ncbi:SDR family NAD(P)-dependent oxidoreductase [Cupriavidus necator]|uniref:SDR family NAD(P)-dependent oxidoreductase n=1 Tax=Cupriavidus necator TaxID=106590 RepID=UPI0005B435FA|nr:SDR family NAD(P)-dependent oxidoreductase [Cupriavidus necator]
MEVKGKRVLITGGSSGIGFALAQALSERGARVFITGRRRAALDQALASLPSAQGVTADVGTQAGRILSLDGVHAAFGGLDILVNNAGAVRAGRLETLSEDEIAAMVNVDLLAPILLTRSAIPLLRASGDAAVVNISSGMGLIGAPFYSVYAAVKAGIAHFGEALRRELDGEGVHVLTVYPGGTDTPMMKSNNAGASLGFVLEPAAAVAAATVDGLNAGALSVVRGGEARANMISLNRADPAAVDARFRAMKAAFEEAVRSHSSL